MDGDYEAEWSDVVSELGGKRAVFSVMSDALKVRGVRVNMSAETQQKVADAVGAVLLTPKLADLAWQQRNAALPPFPRQISSSTQAMVEHSAKVDAALEKLGNPQGLKQTVGKHWVISEGLRGSRMAMNYGWHFAGRDFQGIRGAECASKLKGEAGQVVRVIQGCGTAHDMHHSDYSQVCVLTSRTCSVDGATWDLLDLLRDRDLSWLASHEGPMTVLRQPGVPEPTAPVTVLPRTVVTPE